MNSGDHGKPGSAIRQRRRGVSTGRHLPIHEALDVFGSLILRACPTGFPHFLVGVVGSVDGDDDLADLSISTLATSIPAF